MKDYELRGLLLQKLYELRRRSGFIDVAQIEDKQLLEQFGDDLLRICGHLHENGLIEWKPIQGRGRVVGALVKINAYGIDVAEGKTVPPVAISLNNSINVHSSSYVQIGNSNLQTGDIALEKLIAAVNNSKATENEKAEAKSLIDKLFSNPLVTAALKTILPATLSPKKE